MKLFVLFLLSCGFLFSCSNNEEILEVCNSELSTRSAGDGEYDVLGMGYDVTGEYLHPLSVRNPVLDVQKYKQDRGGRLVIGTPSFGYDKMSSGYSSADYLKKITEESKVKINLHFGTPKDTMACFNQTITNTFKSNYSHSSIYSFASLDAVRNQKYIRINDEVCDISKYLSAEFIEDLSRLPATKIVERYGTHVLTDFIIGGRYKLMFRSVISKTMDSITKRKAVESGFGLSLKKIGFNINVENSTEIEESLAVENKNKELYVLYYGGSGPNLKYDLEKGMPTTVDMQGWENSLNLSNVNLTSINWKETYPIYEFIQDPIKKQEIKLAVEQYIEGAQLKVLELIPLYTYGDEGSSPYFGTPNGYSTTQILLPDSKLDCFEGYIFKNQEKGTVPLYQYLMPGLYGYTTTENVPEGSLMWISGYVYLDSNKDGNLRPMYHYFTMSNSFNPPLKLHHTTTKSNIPEIYPKWRRDNPLILYYLYPAN